MGYIKCEEGEVKEAAPDMGVDFCHVDSCMTITCILGDGTKIAAHDALYKRVEPHIFKNLHGRLQGRKPVKVIACGSGGNWTPLMKGTPEVAKREMEKLPAGKEISEQEFARLMAPCFIDKNKDLFKQILSWQFDLAKKDCEFKDIETGKPKITPQGKLDPP